jgi:hypothetical protein
MIHLEEGGMKQADKNKLVIFLEMRYRNRWMIHLEEREMKQTGYLPGHRI